MTAKVEPKETTSTLLIGRWEEVGRKLLTLAEALPEKNYEFSPVKGVRTVGDVLRHVAFWYQFVAESVRGKQADGTANELPKSQYAKKARILDALKTSTEEASAALREKQEELDGSTAEMVVTFIEHTSEHYGQLVVYARLNGLTPPSSRA